MANRLLHHPKYCIENKKSVERNFNVPSGTDEHQPLQDYYEF